jgi:hypothetical protein
MAAINDTTKTALIQLLTLQQQQMAILQALLGGATITAAAAAPGSVAGSKKSGKGTRGPRGSSGWDLFKKQVRKEMSDANPGVKYKLKEVADECASRKASGAYDEVHWKAQAAAGKFGGGGSVGSASESEGEDASTDSKKRGRPKGSKNKPKTEAAPAVAAKPLNAAAVLLQRIAADEAEEDDDEEADDNTVDAVEWIFKGKKYFKSSANEVWENISGVPGELKGRYNALSNKIEPI